MEDNMGDSLHCEEHLRSTLYCDDKDKLVKVALKTLFPLGSFHRKFSHDFSSTSSHMNIFPTQLRRKLALLQREYLKTAQRLQRAERLDAVQRHVRSRINQQNHQDQRDQEVTSNPYLNTSSLTLNTTIATAQGIPNCQGHTEGSADSDYSKRKQVIRFLLPSDASQTPDPSHDIGRGNRPSPTMRLRSRRSRLRWERRSGEARWMSDNSEEGQEQSERMETARIEGEKEEIKSEETEVVNESEELFSASESESPSLLLAHWLHAKTDTGDMDVKEIQGCQEQREKQRELSAESKKESGSLLQCWNPAIHSEERGQDCTLNGRLKEIEVGEDGENAGGESEIRPCEENNNKDTEQNEAKNDTIENEKKHENTMELKEVKNGMEGYGKSVGLLDSCTLVEGLLFPAEYYVRTTRRMTLSQSQPDMQAVILSHLGTGRHRWVRSCRGGRSRGLNRNTVTTERADEQTQTDFSSLTPASVKPPKLSHVQAEDAYAELTSNTQSSSEISDQISDSQTNTDSFSSPTVCTYRPGRGRRKKRGRGRGRPQAPRSFLSLDTNNLVLQQTSDNPQPTSIPVSPSLSPHTAEGPASCLTLQEAVPVPNDPELASTHSTATRLSSAFNGAQSNPASGHLKEVYPIFLKSFVKSNISMQMNKSTVSWQSLLLPCSPPAQTSLHPLSFQPPGSLINSLKNFDFHQDFHLPDDQFASLKLHKLRQVAMESGVESFTSPCYNTRNAKRRSEPCCTSSTDLVIPLPLSLTPTITDSPSFLEDKRATTHSVHFSNLSIDHELANQPLAEGSTDQGSTEMPREQQTENPCEQSHTSSTESVSVVEVAAADCISPYKEQETVTLKSHKKSSMFTSNTHGSVDHYQPQPHLNLVDRPASKVHDSDSGHSNEFKIKQPASEKQTDCAGVVPPLEVHMPKTYRSEHKATKTLPFDCPLQETPEEVSNNCTAAEACNDTEAPGDPDVKHLNVTSLATDSKELSEPTTNPVRDKSVNSKNQEKGLTHHSVHSKLLLSPPLDSVACPFGTPHLPSSALLSSPTLPSLGVTPHPAFPLTSSSSAPSLTLPPPHTPSIQNLSPPVLSPCPSFTLPASLPPDSPSPQNHSSLDAPNTADQCHRIEPPACLPASSIQLQGSGGRVHPGIEETAGENTLRPTHTLKAPAGGSLVDACCLTGHSGGLCVAAAGKWAVCLWSQISTSNWSLIHTWTFDEPVISVFAVPDASGLMCVALGQLEIREVRILSCSILSQVLLCKELIQAVVGVPNSRVVTSSLIATGSILEVFNLSDSSSTLSSQLLVSPGVCVGALCPVDGLSDALIGTDERGCLFIWNLKTGQLLRRVTITNDLLHTACLQGYSYCGVLFVLLQHQLLISLDGEGRETKAKDKMFSEEANKEEKKQTALFSLVAVNPLSEKSVVATKLYPPKAWSGRLCEADVNSSSVVGLSQSGSVCVWELGHQGDSRMVWAPESEGWQLARWGGRNVLVTGHHNGDVTLHCYR